MGIRYNHLCKAVLTCTHNLFLIKNKKNNVYPCKSKLYCIKVGFKGVKFIKACFCDDEIFSMVILSLRLIQEEQLSVSGKRMCTNTGLPLRELSLPRKKCG